MLTWIAIWFSMNSNGTELDKSLSPIYIRHYTGAVCQEGLVNLIPIHTSEFCFLVSGFQSSLLVILFCYSLDTCSHCDEEWQKWIWYVTNYLITWTEVPGGCLRDIDWSTVLPVFQGSFPKYTQTIVNCSFVAKEHFHYSIILIQK